MRVGFALVLSLVALGAAAHEYTLDKLTIAHPWAPITHGGLKVGVVYVAFVNEGAKADRLLKVSSPIAKSATIHASVQDGAVSRMHPVDAVDIPAGQTIELKQGALHIMLEGLDHPLKNGDTFPLTLTLANEGEVKVEVVVADN